jgi:hypothetical protein
MLSFNSPKPTKGLDALSQESNKTQILMRGMVAN